MILASLFVFAACYGKQDLIGQTTANNIVYDIGSFTYGGGNTGNVGYVVRSQAKSLSGEITILDTYNGYHVCVIQEFAFDSCTSITKITIPKTVYFIQRGAFIRCTGLKEVESR